MSSIDARSPASPDLVTYRLRRERELSSLYATARSLTALGEIDAVLDSIVREAHELVGTDFTYLSLLGDDGELTVTASQGTISPAFRAAHIPSGTGVGGRVIATGAAAWVSNYLATRDVLHDETFDDLVTPEGMVALLGVPLLVRGEVIGVLFAADRTERPFENDEVALLSAFADHAAVALNNARLYAESRSALRELQDAYATIEQQVAVMERAQSVHESLTRVVLTGGGAQEIAQLLVEHLHGAVTVFDRSGAVVATCTHGPDVAALTVPRPSPDAVEQARQSGRWATTTDRTGVYNSAATVQAGDTHLGVLLLTRSYEPAAGDIRTLERAAQIMGLLILKETAVAEAEERVSGELLTELLLAAGPIGPGLRSRAQTRGVDVGALDVLVVAESDTRGAAEVGRRLHAMSHEWSGVAGEHLGHATMLLSATDAPQAARTIHARLKRELGSPVRVVAERVADERWGAAHLLAVRCAALMQTLGVSDRGATTGDFAMFALLFDSERRDDLDRFLDTSLTSLVDHDARRSTALVPTLTAYFKHAGHLRRTADDLHVHLNTLVKRLDRVDSILGDDWRSPDRALQLHVALRLHELRSAPS
ncbi:helix-turn-helix domain-containing protein [Aeromicrobium endophyticum]|uniref:GAF domain-containing protein n=1 Tax=Aeromicrobium endophyticum TaxID=2292704 RepID=A0A371PEW0_9ACTN|nr:GAF domain-containing protein [Aeromicrobium endophyticum]REK74038.1 GAF domain-containing protein [Aeromicrobium endophyticum]